MEHLPLIMRIGAILAAILSMILNLWLYKRKRRGFDFLVAGFSATGAMLFVLRGAGVIKLTIAAQIWIPVLMVAYIMLAGKAIVSLR